MDRREFHQIARTGRTRVWTVEVRGREVITEFGELGGKMQRVVDVGVRKNVGRSNEVSEEEDALYQAERGILERVRQGYAEQGTEVARKIDWYSTLPINLRFYKPDNDLSTALVKRLLAGGAWYTRKRDGEMMVVVKGPDGKVDVYSRKMLRGHHLEEGLYTWNDRFGPLVEELERRADVPNCSILLGDMVHDPKDDGRWEVASFMKSKTPEALEKPPLFYYCWDIAFWDGADLISQTAVGDRFQLIWGTFGVLKADSGHSIPTWPGDSFVLPVEAWEVAQLRRMSGLGIEDPIELGRAVAKKWDWEGWVVVDPHGEYGDRAYNFRGKTDRPGKFCGKLKPTYEDDFVAMFDPEGAVLGRGTQGKWGTGNHRGKVGSVNLYQYDSRGRLVYICDAGGGIDDEFRAAYSSPSKYPLVVKIEFNDRTYTAEGDKTNALQFPRIVEVRTDKEPAECVNPQL